MTVKIATTRCPFAAHTRKTRPRADLKREDTMHHIIRAGIPYGPEVTPEESQSNKTGTSLERGFCFWLVTNRCYGSRIPIRLSSELPLFAAGLGHNNLLVRAFGSFFKPGTGVSVHPIWPPAKSHSHYGKTFSFLPYHHCTSNERVNIIFPASSPTL